MSRRRNFGTRSLTCQGRDLPAPAANRQMPEHIALLLRAESLLSKRAEDLRVGVNLVM
jgi:hypothetical protein